MCEECVMEARPYKDCSTMPKSRFAETVVFDKDELYNLIDFIEVEFIDAIRRDTDVDNIDYIISMMNALTKLRYAYKNIKTLEESV